MGELSPTHTTDRRRPRVGPRTRAFALAGLGLVLLSAVYRDWATLGVPDPRTRPTPNSIDHAWGWNLDGFESPQDDLFVMPNRLRPHAALTRPDIDTGWADRHLPEGLFVVGLVVNGEARAYPYEYLRHHQVINDTLGGEPVAISHSPLTQTTIAFSRRVGDEALEFASSDLFFRTAHLLFDRREDPRDQSLWSPPLLRAVSGPAAERAARLEMLNGLILRWGEWWRRHPETTVATDRTGYLFNYGADRFGEYHEGRQWFFPEDWASGRRPDLHPSAPMLLVRLGEAERLYPLDLLSPHGPALEDRLGDYEIRVRRMGTDMRARVRVVRWRQRRAFIESGREWNPPEPMLAYGAWGTWDALRPDIGVYDGGTTVNSQD